MPVGHADLVEAAHLGDVDVHRLARKLYAIKAKAYRDALLEAEQRHGGVRQRVILSQSIRDAIAEEAMEHARYAVQTFNRQMDAFERRHRDLGRDEFVARFRPWLRARARSRSRVVASMAPLTARLDAQIGFYRENGVEPEFDFAGPAAKCELCKALKAGSPWPIETILQVGTPHLNCTHSWRARTRAIAELRAGGLRPGQISAGRGDPAGILGSKAMVQRLGSTDVALQSLEGMR